jgi:hypothetical protein
MVNDPLFAKLERLFVLFAAFYFIDILNKQAKDAKVSHVCDLT